MRKTRKVMALLLALVMVLAMGVTAFADGEGHTITVDSSDTHTYKVFQVLTGTLASTGSKELGNPAWGADAIANPGSVNDFITAITAEGLTNQQIAQLVAAKVNTSGDGRGTVDKDHPMTGLATGYYVMVDVTNPLDDNDMLGLHVVKVLNDVTLDIKHDTTSDDKTISGDTLAKDGDEKNEYDPGAKDDNVSVGDTVYYNIAAKVPANATQFKPGTFFFVITDKLSDGLTFTEGSIEVYQGTTKLAADKYTVQYNVHGNTFEIGLIDAEQYAGKTINVKYAAVLNENAVIGDAGNPNSSTVQFSNDPNKTYDGDPEDQNHPGFPDSNKDVPTGETPESVTKTYTTGIEILKVDQDGKVLTGASFEISGQSTKTVLTVKETFAEDAAGTYYKLKDGTYTKTAPTTADTMVPAEAGATAGYVVDEDYEGSDKKVVDGVTYRPYVPETDSGKTIYVLVEGNADLYESTTVKYKKTETKTAVDATTSHKAEVAVDANGLARFDGLGAGTYTIKETVTPSGYNTIDDFTVTVTYDADGNAKFSFSGGNGSYDASEGIYKITIENNKGTQLPETGSIGRTIFYVAGSVLVLGAAVLLITRRRMKDEI